MRLQNVESDPPQPVDLLHVEAARFSRPVVLSLLAEEVPDLVPEPLARAQVLFFALPASMEQLLPRLLEAQWDCYGDLTDHPWTHAVYLALKDGMDGAAAVPGGSEPIVTFRSDAVDLSRAFDEGFLILMFDCAGLLWTRGISAGDDLATALSACAQSTFQRPLRIHSVRYLQERTRLVEGTGVDPEGPPAGGYPVLPALCSRLARAKPFDLSRLPEHKRRHLPMVSWHRISDAVIGWLPEVTHFQEECAGESPLVLKVTVMPEMHARIKSGEFSCVVRLAPEGEQCGDPTYVLLVESARELTAVTMSSCDSRFRAVYRYWARVGTCQVAFENFHNGRLHRSRVAWPATAPGKGICEDSVGKLTESGLVRSCSAVESLVRERVRRGGVCLTCYTCGVTDQESWREGREDS
jgi:hypothetical protein